MLRLFVIVMPLLVAVGATYFALRMPPTGTSEQRFVKSMIGASVVGILLSVITLQHERSMAVQLGEARPRPTRPRPTLLAPAEAPLRAPTVDCRAQAICRPAPRQPALLHAQSHVEAGLVPAGLIRNFLIPSPCPPLAA